MQTMAYILALLIGLIVPVQALVNHQMQKSIGGTPILAAWVSFIVGTLLLTAVTIITGQKFTGKMPWEIEWWKLIGGCMGALFVFGTVFIAPRIGVAAMVCLIVMGQVITSLVFDKIGFLGAQIRELTLPRIIGAGLIIIGVIAFNFDDLRKQIFPKSANDSATASKVMEAKKD